MLSAAQSAVSYVRAVGQEASPSKCVLLSTPKIEDVPDHANILSDDSRKPIPHVDVEVAGGGVFTHVLVLSLITMRTCPRS